MTNSASIGFGSPSKTEAKSGEILRSKWESLEQIEKLRADNKCFQCEKISCYAKVCPLLPWKGPAYNKDVPRPDKPLLKQHIIYCIYKIAHAFCTETVTLRSRLHTKLTPQRI